MTARTKAEAENGSTILIPLNKLKKLPKNARKIPHTDAEIEALAASIAAKGLLQNLVFEPRSGRRRRGAILGGFRRCSFLKP